MKKRLLFITPDLKRSGAPIAIHRLIQIIIEKEDYEISVMSYGNGVLLSSYIELLGEDHITILNGLNPTEEFRWHLQNDYDIVFLNTAAAHTFIFYFQNTNIPVYWWLHEAPDMIENNYPAFPNPHLLSPNFRLLLPSMTASSLFKAHYTYDDVFTLHPPIFFNDDINEELQIDIPSDRIVFFVPGAYSYIKGQDILLSAISSLSEKYRKRSLFIFCGYSLETQKEYRDAIFNTAFNMDNVLMLEELSQETVFSLMLRCHCVIAPSRVDCLPTTIAEGLMLKKLCLVSNHTGISFYMQDCVNGFIFNNKEELIKRLLLIINDFESISRIGSNGFKIYTDNFSPVAISNSLSEINLL